MSAAIKIGWIYLAVIVKTALLMVLRRPYKLTLLASSGCNLKCRVCKAWQSADVSISLDEVKQIWSAFPIKPCWINISGGEPLLNPELEAILLFFASMPRSFFITLTTNGFADCAPLVKRVLEQSKRALVYVSVSIDGDSIEHNRIRGRSSAWDRARQTHQNLTALKTEHACLTVGVSTTVSRINSDEVVSFIENTPGLTRALTVNIAGQSPYYHNGDADDDLFLPPEPLKALLSKIQRSTFRISATGIIKTLFLDAALRRLNGKPTGLPCTSYFSNVLVTSELAPVNCIPLFEPWEGSCGDRSANLAALLRTIRSPKERRRALGRQIAASRCETRCLTPCEVYLHIIAALLHPIRAAVLWTRFILLCLRVALRKNLTLSCPNPKTRWNRARSHLRSGL